MNKNIKINNIIIEPKGKDNYNNSIEFLLEGNDINYTIMNTLRRSIEEYIPSFAYEPENIDIDKNTSIYSNDEIRERISLTPVLGINNDINNINELLRLETDTNRTKFDNNDNINLQEIRSKELSERAVNLSMRIPKIKNNTNSILSITTDKAIFRYNSKVIESPYKPPLLLIKLNPDQEISCTCYSTLNIPLKHARYLSVAACFYEELEENKFKFYIESIGQIKEKDILIRAILLIIIKLNKLKEIIIYKIKNYTYENNKDIYNLDNKIEDIDEDIDKHLKIGTLKIEHESHTMGPLITRYLQEHKNIKFSGYKIEQLLIKEVKINYKTDGENIIKIFNDVFDKIINIFNNIKKEFDTIKM